MVKDPLISCACFQVYDPFDCVRSLNHILGWSYKVAHRVRVVAYQVEVFAA